MKRIVTTILLVLSIAAAVWPATLQQSLKVPWSQFQLDNGLRVVLSEDHSAPVVAVAVYYDVGSRNEVKGRTGFAHLFEHMMFQGSQNVGKGEHFVLIENNGWSMFTRISERRCVIRTDSLADAFGIPYERLTGNDPWRYIAALSRLRNIAIEQRSPVIVEIEVSTLGDVTLPAEGRHINYHHGVAPVTFSDWPLIKQDPSDPVHVLMERLGEPTAREIAGRIHASLLDEINS